ncbi:Ig-like domain-containing protein [Ruegeria sp.]|uniref:beta strand repeat-containing protein n=1 Tax=Ruegeria sp. TaxID=1879320 RepID=UPI002311BF1E|nr:Ig-like domain-containing protein [Ruegeria sp.]MDA7963995.1 Ig-like domain-containing protein [Ruegeria sp.]
MTKKPVSTTPRSDALPEDGRNRHVRKWIDGKLRKWAGRGLAGGLGSTLMALPALAQATDAELAAFQFAESIPGVRSVKLLSNGDLQLKMVDGRTLIVAAENVQVLDNGAIMVADAVVGEITEFSAAAEGAGAASGGLGGIGAVAGGLGLAGAAAAGGGGGDDAPATAPPAPAPALPSLNLAGLQASALNNTSANLRTPEGAATVEITIGGLVKTVTVDVDGNWSLSLTQAEATGLSQGTTTITVRNLDAMGAEISVQTVDYIVDTVPPTIGISGFSAGAVLNAAEQGADLTITGTTDAENGQIVTVTLNGQTYTGTVSNGGWSVAVPAGDLTALSDASTIAVTADVSDTAGNPASQASGSFDTDFNAPAVTLDAVAGGSIDLVDVGGDLVLTGTTTAEDGQTVTITFEGQDYTGTASGGGWSVTIPNADLTGLSTGTPAAISVAVSDAAGNPAAPVSVSVPVDLTGPSISIAPLSVGAAINAAEVGSDLTISGTTGNVPDGQQVTVTLDGQTYTGTVSGGNWSVTVPNADLGALSDGGSFTVTADVADADGLVAPQASVGVTKDVTAPTLSIDSFSDGAVMSAAEQGTDLTISGSTTAEDGQTVTVTLNGQSYTGAASGGGWSVTVPAADLGALSNGATVAVTADVSDVAGNPAVQATNSFDTDFTPPSLTISTLSDGAVMNAAEQGTDLTVTGTSDAPDGTVVTVEITRPDGTVDVSGTATVTGGNWTYTASAASLSGLQDAESYDVNASISDVAGNENSTSASFDTDFSAPSITLDPLPVGGQLDIVEQGSDLMISGTTTAEDGQIVTVTLGGQSYTGAVSGGTWAVTVPSADLTGLADSTSHTITASVEDAAGNPASDATTSVTTDFRPLLNINPVGTNDAVALSDAQASGLTVTGTSVGLAAGQSVDVTLNSVSVGSATVAADGSWSLTVPASDFAGLGAGDSMDFGAQATVSGGPDPAPASDQVTAHVPAAYVITEVGQSGSTITFEIYADTDRDTSSGLAVTADLEFDPSVVTFDSGSDVENGDFDLFLVNTPSPTTVSFAGAATSYGDLSQPIVTFTMTVQDPTKPIEFTITTTDGGPSQFVLGTGGNDTLSGSSIDDVIRGGAGDDNIDLSGAGRDIVVLEASPTANGVDTISGFTLGSETDVADALMFQGLDVTTLRGDGSGFETLNVGDALGTNTGFVGLQTTLSDLTSDTIATAVEGLTGALSGDEIYVLATDGTDSVLVKVDYTAPDTASVETLAQFDGLSDLSGLTADNILHTDPTGASA